ncbi:GNAT family N-acetyltransferase [Rhodobacterales bacterium HKCCE4037]|nr:GNAT family N-acetyltransferase [Rhodobacterales bacterium HKCCE4037]
MSELLAALHAASFERGWSAHEFDTLLANPAYRVVTSDTGFALLQIIPPEAELITISILPAARGKGAGRDLLSRTITEAEQAGVTQLFLDVDATNTAALTLYRSAGFAEVGRRKGYYAHEDASPADAIQMVLSLPAQSSGK